jgi:hypothetical protein
MTTPSQTFTERDVRDILNDTTDEIIEVAELPDTGTVDALNLLVNATLYRLVNGSGATLAEVVDANYDDSLSSVLEWINS